MKRAFTNQQVAEIQTRLDAGETTKDLAIEFKVSTTTIKNIRNNSYVIKAKKTGPKAQPIEERLDKSIEKRGEDECWFWKGADRNGQGTPTISSDGNNEIAYRVVFERSYRPLNPGEWVLHSCDGGNKCMNPKHLYVGNRFDWARQFRKDVTPEEVEWRREVAQKRARSRYTKNQLKIRHESSLYQLERKLAAVIYMGGVCQGGCGETHPAALQFHHRDPSQKEFSVNAKTLCTPVKIPWNMMKKELEKCDLLCSNCHAKHHTSWTQEMIERKRKTLEAYGLQNIYEGNV